MDRANHYETAFAAYLDEHGVSYIAVDETRRALLGGLPVKSLDFIVFGSGAGLLVDVKGRRYPAGLPERPRRVWECWSTREDITGLLQWAERFGPGYRALLVFAYHLGRDESPVECEENVWRWRGRRYLFRAVPVDEYALHLRVRSRRWATVEVSGSIFRKLARPLDHYIAEPKLVAEECPF